LGALLSNTGENYYFLSAEPIAMRNLHLKRIPLFLFSILWLLLLLPSLSGYSQTTNISGVVNTYHSVLAVGQAESRFKLNTVAGLNRNDRVLIVQMKGATINTTNTNGSAYGDTTALNNAGNYEVNTICAIRNDTVYMVYNLLNNYTSAGKVQLVRFGSYVNANVNGVLTANSWNNTAGTGGVIALYVEQDLTLNNIITADARGFAGGAGNLSGSTCNNSHNLMAYDAFIGDPSTQNGAFKGEGIVDIPAAESGGRGAPANGGGGGNDHNNSGGGGANLVAGGIGGGNSSRISLGACYASWPGRAGKALSSWAGQKIFLGGGGGAGHKNFAGSFSNGANGGGIIFIHAGNLIGNGFQITSGGGYGGNSQSDGAGGGGGGGTIIMDVPAYTGSLTIRAEGGHGGDSENGLNFNKCFGGGGGGSGGVIYFSGATPALAISANGGGQGIETGREVSCQATPIPAASGLTGLIIPNYTYRTSLSLGPYCSAILPVRLGYFDASVLQKEVILKWQIHNPEEASSFTVERLDKNGEWKVLQTVTASDFQKVYEWTDITPAGGFNSYRIRVNEKNNGIVYTAVRKVFIGVTVESFSIFPNPASDKITLRGSFDASADIRLTDVSGKVILRTRSGSANITEIKLPALSAGIYMLHVNNGIEKLVIR
jgi:hypothetical protein